jgi:hypothetical protein
MFEFQIAILCLTVVVRKAMFQVAGLPKDAQLCSGVAVICNTNKNNL